MSADYAELAMKEFEVTKKQSILKGLIAKVIKTKEDLEELRNNLEGKGNKMYDVLCKMRRERSK